MLSGFMPLEQLADAVGFELEHALGVAALQQGVGLRIVERQLVEVDLDRRASCAIRRTALSSSVSVRRPRKSILSRPTFSRSPMTHCVVTTASSPLAAGVVALADDALQRHVIGERTVGDDDAGGVRAGIAVGAFQLAGDVDQLAHVGSASYCLLQIGALLEGFVEGDAERLAGSSWSAG